MGFPADVLQVQRSEQDLNALQFVLLSFSLSCRCNQHHKNNHLCKQLWICECFCDLPCLPQDYKLDEIEISELVVNEFCNKHLTEFFIFTAKRELEGACHLAMSRLESC